MADLTSIYSINNQDLLDIHNPVAIDSEINSIISTLYNDVISKRITLINQTEIIQEYFDIQPRIPLSFVSNLYYKDGESYKGYNILKIGSVVNKTDDVLDYIEDDYSYILFNLKNIKSEVTSNLSTFQKLNRFYFSFPHDNLILLSNSNLFKYFFNILPINDSTKTENSFVTNFFLFLIIQPAYVSELTQLFSDFRFKVFTTSEPDDPNITEEELNITTDDVFEGFDNYIDLNVDLLSEEISRYLISNIFILNDPSEPFVDDFTSLMNDLVLKFKDIFSDVISVISSFQQTIAINSISSFANYLTSKDILNREDYISISSESDILNDENYIHEKFLNVISTTENLNVASLEFITYQFKDSPLYFLNSHIIAYNNYLNDILQDPEFFDNIDFISINESEDNEHTPNLTNWLSKISIDINDFFSHRDNLDINTEFHNSKSLDLTFNKFCINIILKFIDSEEFHKLLVVDLILITKQVESYIPNHRSMIVENIGRLKLFIKIFLIKSVLDKNLFGDLFQKFKDAFDDIDITFSESSSSENIINGGISPSDNIKKSYLKFVKGMLYSSTISTVLNKVFDQYRI